MKMYDISVPGMPVGKARPRVTRTGIVYTPKKTASMENLLKIAFTEKYPGHVPLEGMIEMLVLSYFPLPKSMPKKKKALAVAGIISPTSRPDVDNIIKLAMDALEGVAYARDSCIVGAAIKKFYSARPRTEVVLRKVQPVGLDDTVITKGELPE